MCCNTNIYTHTNAQNRISYIKIEQYVFVNGLREGYYQFGFDIAKSTTHVALHAFLSNSLDFQNKLYFITFVHRKCPYNNVCRKTYVLRLLDMYVIV